MEQLPYKSQLLRLYKRIMGVHKKLPPKFQSLGNQYVKAEFGSMKKVEKKEQVEVYVKGCPLELVLIVAIDLLKNGNTMQIQLKNRHEVKTLEFTWMKREFKSSMMTKKLSFTSLETKL